MTQTQRMAVLLLLGAVVCAAAVPPEDDPETAFDESAAAVTVALTSSTYIKLVPSVGSSILLPERAFLASREGLADSASRPARMPKQGSPDCLRKLLCTFLI